MLFFTFCDRMGYLLKALCKFNWQQSPNKAATCVKILGAISCIVFLLHTPLQAQTVVWAKNFGGSGYIEMQTTFADGSGNVYVTGSFRDTVIFGYYSFYNPYFRFSFGIPISLTSYGESDIFVAKYNSFGKLLWVRQAGGEHFDYGLDIGVDYLGNVYVTGDFSKLAYFKRTTSKATSLFLEHTADTRVHMFLVKYNASGTVQWVRKGTSIYGDEDGMGLAVERYTGDVIVTGRYNGRLQFSGKTFSDLTSQPFSQNMFVSKCSTSGEWQWAKKAGGNWETRGQAVCIDKYDGNIYVVGAAGGTSDFGSGQILNTDNGAEDVFIAKYSPSGSLIWLRQAGDNTGSSREGAHDIDVDVLGNIYLTGRFSSNIRFGDTELINPTPVGEVYPNNHIFIAKYNAGGTPQWAKRISETPSSDYRPTSISVGPLGGIYITGRFSTEAVFDNNILLPEGSSDIFVAKYYHTGEVNWVKKVGGPGPDSNKKGIGIDNLENVYIGGSIIGSSMGSGVTIDGVYIGQDHFITKIAPPPAITVTSFTLVNADTDTDIGILSNFGTIDYEVLGTRNINIRANTTDAVSSVVFVLGSDRRTENTVPYALWGDSGGNYNAFSLAPSSSFYSISATPYSQDNGLGVRGPASLFFFKVIGGANMRMNNSVNEVQSIESPTFEVYPVPSSAKVYLRFKTTYTGMASLKIYNMQGIEIKELYSGEALAERWNQIELTEKQLYPGMYVARLTWGNQRISKKLIITH